MGEGDDEGAAFVQEAICADRVIVFKVRVVGRGAAALDPGARTVHAVVAAAGAGLLTPEARREAWGGKLPPGVERQKAREGPLTGARLVALGDTDAFINQHGDPRVVRAKGDRVVVTDERPPHGLGSFVARLAVERSALEARGEAVARAVAAGALEIRRAEVDRILDRATSKIERRREAIRGDLTKIAESDRVASQAQWLIAEATKAPRGATKLVVTDWSSGEAIPLEIRLDPSKSAKDQVLAMFKRAKRLRLGGKIADERLAQAEAQLAALAGAREAATAAASLVSLEEILVHAKRAAPRDVALPSMSTSTSTSTSTRGKRRVSFRTFYARSGRKLLVGKGAADNDELTLHIARPHDLWLHAKERTGAHVVVPLERGHSCPAEDLVDAAHLAAHFSDGRDELLVDVQYTDRRYLRKPKGSAPGLVIVDREKVIGLRLEKEILRGLLEREET